MLHAELSLFKVSNDEIRERAWWSSRDITDVKDGVHVVMPELRSTVLRDELWIFFLADVLFPGKLEQER